MNKAAPPSKLEQQLRDMNEALLVSSVKQHELAEKAQKAEAAARESEERFRAFVTASSDVVYRMSPDWSEMLQLDGRDYIVDTEKPSGVWLQEYIHPDDQPQVMAVVAEAIRTKTIFELQHRVRRLDGTLGWTFSRAVPLLDAKGEIVEWFGVASDVTERKLAEEALRISEERGRLALDSAELGAFSIDIATKTLMADERFRSIFGIAVGQIDYERALAIVHPEDRAQQRDALAAAVRPDATAPYIAEYRVVHPDGSIRWVFARGRANFAQEGSARKLLSFNGTVADITERKQAEKALLESEERYRNLFNSMDEGYCIIEMLFDEYEKPVDYRFLEVNPSFEKQSGLHDVTGKWMRELQPDLEEHWFETYGKVAQTGEPVRFVNEAKTLEGRWFDLYAFQVGGRDSRKVAVVFNDITERRKSEQALAKSLVFANDIIATLREPFMVLDYDLRVKTANRSFYDTFQVSKEETENRLVYDLGNGQWDIPALRKLLDEVLSRNQSVHDFEVEHSFPALGRKNMLLNARPFPPDTKHPELILLAVEDVSAVRERADELAAVNRRKDEFLAMLSHELRNPLAPILNATQLLRLEQGESRLHQQAHAIIERQLGQLVHLVDDLLEVSRISTGKIHLQYKQLDLRSIVECGAETACLLIEQRRHALDVRLPPTPIWIDGDATRLEQVVVNLLNNAAKYMDEGGQIWLSLQQEGNEAVLRVRDSGIGIAPELMPHIFDLFTQAERSLARSEGGLGIGLSLVHRLVELHGGKVSASSAVGQGSEFVVRLPMVLTAEPRLPSPPTKKIKPTGPALRILVVDDNEDTAETLARLLRYSGHEVRTAQDGPMALEMALDCRPNVVLLDIGLPGLDGFEVAKRMRQLPVLQNVVLVAMTGYGQESDRRRSREAGFDDHLVKPANFNHLQKILANVSEMAT